MFSRLFRSYFWAVVLLGAAYLIDLKTGYEISVLVLYAFPIAYAAWHGGRVGGLVFTVLCVAAWRVADIQAGHPYSAQWITWEKSVNVFLLLAFIAFSFDFFRRTQEKDRQRLRDLESILPICNVCHRIKDPEGQWVDFETNLKRHLGDEHHRRICPDCADAKYMTDTTL